ncbi:MAG: calcium-binding protein [Planctomycetes bacterium]|nr:calcium-binding protein [Planctomycetota bacterium]
MSAQVTLRANVTSAGWPAWHTCSQADVSGDGSLVLFQSSTNLTPSQPTPWSQVYLYARATGAVTMVSVANDGSPADLGSAWPVLSSDGRFAAFASSGSNLIAGDTNGWEDVFVRDRVLGTTVCASTNVFGATANSYSRSFGLSNDGARVAFDSAASDLVVGDGNGLQDVFVRDLVAQSTVLASTAIGGAAGNGASTGGGLSGDGRLVVFDSEASDLVANDTNGCEDVFVRDLVLGTTARVSVSSLGGQASGISRLSQISTDGRFVSFVSFASDLVPGDTNGFIDAFLYDRQFGLVERISVGPGGVEANSVTVDGGVSRDGRYVTFVSMASNLVAPALGGFERDVFVRDRVLGLNWHASRGPAGVRANAPCFRPRVADDGQTVVYPSDASNLVAGDINDTRDVFVTSSQALGVVTTYGTAKTSSAGCASFVTTAGFPRATGDDAFRVVATGVLVDKSGMFFWGRASASQPFGGGTLLVQPPLVRTPVQNSGSSSLGAGCSGHFSFHFSQAYMASELVFPGDTLYGQFWSRDPGFAPPDNIGLSNAVQFVVGP